MSPTALTSWDGEDGSNIEVGLRFDHWTRLRDCDFYNLVETRGRLVNATARSEIAAPGLGLGLPVYLIKSRKPRHHACFS
jgi:hypothetical protein